MVVLKEMVFAVIFAVCAVSAADFLIWVLEMLGLLR